MYLLNSNISEELKYKASSYITATLDTYLLAKLVSSHPVQSNLAGLHEEHKYYSVADVFSHLLSKSVEGGSSKEWHPLKAIYLHR